MTVPMERVENRILSIRALMQPPTKSRRRIGPRVRNYFGQSPIRVATSSSFDA